MMSRQIKVGLFVILGLLLTMISVFLIGDTKRLWEPKVDYHAAFQDVAGLKPGAPVRMGGVDIGSVTGVGHGENPGDARIYVSLSISKKEGSRIRTDSLAHVVNKGLLGDKMIEITTGSPGAAMLDPKEMIKTEEPSDVFSAANKLAASTQEAIERLEPLARALGDPKFAEDLKGTAADFHQLVGAMVRGDGAVHRLFFDKSEADRIDALLANLDRTSAHVDAVLADVQDVTTHVRQGPGIAHAIVYDGEISKSAAGSMAEIHQDLKAIREGNGLAHALLYGDDSSQHVMTNLNAMSDDLRAIVSNVRQGRGTLGALLVDPSVYEDIKSVVGNVERNEVLRALVRYSIKADEQHPTPRVDARP
jgi:phospholipid/cholesterol/gamma-HCH transport system substrate-binding protein